ncbi:MAG: CRISPR-associated helicase Cas3' [Bacillota bacterium]
MFAAHIREDGTEQSVEQHLLGVAALGGCFGEKMELSYLAQLIGMLHDFGKYTAAFDAYIRYSHLHPEDRSLRGKIPHALQGALYFCERLGSTSPPRRAAATAALCVASHHGGLMDCVSPDGELLFYKQLERSDPKLHYSEARENYLRECALAIEFDSLFARAAEEFAALMERLKEQKLLCKFNLHLVVRFLFSCLIDADRYDTYCFSAGTSPNSPSPPPWAIMLERLEGYLRRKNPVPFPPKRAAELLAADGSGPTPGEHIGLIRAAISMRCHGAAQYPTGIYRLSVPTGGGKTLSSLRFALAHALKHGKDRIIYVIPFTTILDQNAAVIREALGSEARILEHHSNVLPEKQPDSEDYELLTERWNSDVILTTMVQFLNTLFAGGTRSARRMHSLCNAVLIFDEIQTIPVKCINLFNQALNFLCRACNSTVVLCTATQPELSCVERPLLFSEHPELIPETVSLFRALRRTRIVDSRAPGGYTPELLADFWFERMAGLHTGLAVLNTKKDARALYKEVCRRNGLLPDGERYQIYHLSAAMCPAHRRRALDAMLSEMKAGRVLCISTQLIEAGVDISFHLAIRALAGLDSVAQTAGRCNRNAEAALREVYIVNIAGERLGNLPEIELGKQAAQNVLDSRRFDADSLLSPEAMELYYSMYYAYIKNKMDYPLHNAGLGPSATLYDLLGDNRLGCGVNPNQTKNLPLAQAFGTAGRLFEAIENTATLLVSFGEGEQLIEALRCGELRMAERKKILRRAQQYSVNIYEDAKKQLEKEGAIEVLPDGILVLNKRFYHDEYGVTTQGEKMELLTI